MKCPQPQEAGIEMMVFWEVEKTGFLWAVCKGWGWDPIVWILHSQALLALPFRQRFNFPHSLLSSASYLVAQAFCRVQKGSLCLAGNQRLTEPVLVSAPWSPRLSDRGRPLREPSLLQAEHKCWTLTRAPLSFKEGQQSRGVLGSSLDPKTQGNFPGSGQLWKVCSLREKSGANCGIARYHRTVRA